MGIRKKGNTFCLPLFNLFFIGELSLWAMATAERDGPIKNNESNDKNQRQQIQTVGSAVCSMVMTTTMAKQLAALVFDLCPGHCNPLNAFPALAALRHHRVKSLLAPKAAALDAIYHTAVGLNHQTKRERYRWILWKPTDGGDAGLGGE